MSFLCLPCVFWARRASYMGICDARTLGLVCGCCPRMCADVHVHYVCTALHGCARAGSPSHDLLTPGSLPPQPGHPLPPHTHSHHTCPGNRLEGPTNAEEWRQSLRSPSRGASPRAASPRVASPRVASPRVASPRAASTSPRHSMSVGGRASAVSSRHSPAGTPRLSVSSIGSLHHPSQCPSAPPVARSPRGHSAPSQLLQQHCPSCEVRRACGVID